MRFHKEKTKKPYLPKGESRKPYTAELSIHSFQDGGAVVSRVTSVQECSRFYSPVAWLGPRLSPPLLGFSPIVFLPHFKDMYVRLIGDSPPVLGVSVNVLFCLPVTGL